MERNTVILATLVFSLVIGTSIVLGCYVISRSPRYEALDAAGLQLIETSTGSFHRRTGTTEGGRPKYVCTPGPGTRSAALEWSYKP